MNPAQFNKRIDIYTHTITVDELLQEEVNYDLVASVWAMVKTLQGREYIAAKQVNAEHTTRFVIRYSSTVKQLIQDNSTSLEIHYDNRIYDVESIINDDERNKTFTIIAKGRV